MEELIGELEALLEETGRQHHAAFLKVDGAHPHWANWYADHLTDRLPGLIETGLTGDELAGLLERLGEEQPRVVPEEPWTRYYARFFVERYT
jgi:hypothetical protein